MSSTRETELPFTVSLTCSSETSSVQAGGGVGGEWCVGEREGWIPLEQPLVSRVEERRQR